MITVNEWKNWIEDHLIIEDTKELCIHMHNYFLRRLDFQKEPDGQSNWKTPEETMLQGGGDCEDFAILEYFTLRHMGIAKEDLKFNHVVLTNSGSSIGGHIILLCNCEWSERVWFKDVEKKGELLIDILNPIQEYNHVNLNYRFVYQWNEDRWPLMPEKRKQWKRILTESQIAKDILLYCPNN